jgi:succinoglycan biosynthesis protein ExoO
MANWRGERHLRDAIASVLAQTMQDLELLVADDASDDGSQAIVLQAATRDARVRLLPATSNSGPSNARNRAIAEARGEWLAIMDSDDLIHPRRLELLLEAARRSNADLVADDLAFFGDRPDAAGRTLLGPLGLRDVMPVGPTFLVESNNDSGLPNLGYLKPLIRRSALGVTKYDPEIRVGEDFDFYLRLLLKGLRLVLVPLPLYHYRRHSASLSHRLSVGALQPLLAAHEALVAALSDPDPELARTLAARGAMLKRALRYEELVAEVKKGATPQVAGMILREPILLKNLARSVGERMARRRVDRKLDQAVHTQVLLIPKGRDVSSEVQSFKTGGVILQVPSISAEKLDIAPDVIALSCRLTDLSARGPIDVVALGLDGLDALGLLPEWESAEVWLTENESAAAVGRLPAKAVLKRLARPATSGGMAGDAETT